MTKLAKSVTLLIADAAEGQRECLTVAVLRDTLLPKLISGELRMKGKPGPEKNLPTNLANSRRPN